MKKNIPITSENLNKYITESIPMLSNIQNTDLTDSELKTLQNEFLRNLAKGDFESSLKTIYNNFNYKDTILNSKNRVGLNSLYCICIGMKRSNNLDIKAIEDPFLMQLFDIFRTTENLISNQLQEIGPGKKTIHKMLNEIIEENYLPGIIIILGGIIGHDNDRNITAINRHHKLFKALREIKGPINKALILGPGLIKEGESYTTKTLTSGNKTEKITKEVDCAFSPEVFEFSMNFPEAKITVVDYDSEILKHAHSVPHIESYFSTPNSQDQTNNAQEYYSQLLTSKKTKLDSVKNSITLELEWNKSSIDELPTQNDCILANYVLIYPHGTYKSLSGKSNTELFKYNSEMLASLVSKLKYEGCLIIDEDTMTIMFNTTSLADATRLLMQNIRDSLEKHNMFCDFKAIESEVDNSSSTSYLIITKKRPNFLK